MPQGRVGELLLQRGIVDQGTLESALAAGRLSGMRLLSQIWLMEKAREDDLVQAVADVQGCPGIVLSESAFPFALLDFIPAKAARERRILPVAETDGTLLVAAAESLDNALLDEVRFVTGRRIVLFTALQAPLERAIVDAYAARGGADGRTHFFCAGGDPTRTPRLKILRPSAVKASTVGETPTLQVEDLDRLAEPAEPVRHPVALVIDDDESFRIVISEALAEIDLEVISFADGAQAAEWLKTGTPALVVSDVMLPGVHGFDLARMVKSGDRFGGVPVVLMSAGYRGWRVQEDVKRLGVDAYFEKPFPLDLLQAKVRELLRRDPGPELHKRRLWALDAYAKGAEALKASDLKAAEKHLCWAVEADPMHYRAHFLLAVLYSKQNRNFLAIDHLERMAALDPRDVKTLQTLAAAYESAGFRHQAAGALERAFVAAPDDVRADIRKRLSALLFP